VLAYGREKRLTTVFNPSPVHSSFGHVWPLVDTAVLNQSEASELTGSADPAVASRHILAHGAENVVVTLGERGALLVNRDGMQHVPAVPVVPVDTTGAGDTFLAILVAARSLVGQLDARAVEAATAAAAITVTRLGACSAFPRADEIRSILTRCLGRQG
jgi:ribokinase